MTQFEKTLVDAAEIPAKLETSFFFFFKEMLDYRGYGSQMKQMMNTSRTPKKE